MAAGEISASGLTIIQNCNTAPSVTLSLRSTVTESSETFIVKNTGIYPSILIQGGGEAYTNILTAPNATAQYTIYKNSLGNIKTLLTGGTTSQFLQTNDFFLANSSFQISSGFINVSTFQQQIDFTQPFVISTKQFQTQLLSTGSFYINLLQTTGVSTIDLSTLTASFSTIFMQESTLSISSGQILQNSQILQPVSSLSFQVDSYTVSSIFTNTLTILSNIQYPDKRSTVSLQFTQANQVLPTYGGFYLPIDTSLYSGTLLLPPTSTIKGGFITIEDIQNTFASKPLTLSTTSIDSFFPSYSNRISLTSKLTTLVATAESAYRILKQTQTIIPIFQPTLAQTSSLNTSSLQTTTLYAPTLAQIQSIIF